MIVAGLFFGTLPQGTARAQETMPPPGSGETQAAIAPSDPIEAAVGALGQDDEGVPEVARLLRDPATVLPTLAALNRLVTLPTGLWREVSRRTSADQAAEVRLGATSAIARFGTRESVETLVMLAGDSGAPVAATARRSLRQLTGQGGGSVPWGAQEWDAWGKAAATWTDRTWARMLLTAQSEARRQAAAANRALQEETLNLYRRLHVELDSNGRSALLGELINDDRAWLRGLGFELAGRDLSARTALGEDVAIAAAARMRDSDPKTRAQAASLIGRLVPPDAMLLFTAALREEQDPSAAEPMLLGIARWPNADATDATLRWLERGDAPLDAACTAIWALASRGYLDSDAPRARALTALRSRPFESIGGSGLRTLVLLGTDDDLDRVTAMLSDTQRGDREAAADALGETPAGLARLLAFRDDPRLFSIIARAVTRHDPSPSGFALVAGLPNLDESLAERALIELGSKLDPESLASAVQAAGLPDRVAERVLATLMAADPDSSVGVAEGLLVLAKTRLRLGNAGGAGEALAVLQSVTLPEPLAAERRRATLWVEIRQRDVEGALAVQGVTPAEWIEALSEMSDGDALRGVLAERLVLRFGDSLDAAQLVLLDSWSVPSQGPPEADQSGAETSQSAPSPTTGPTTGPGEPSPKQPGESGPVDDPVNKPESEPTGVSEDPRGPAGAEDMNEIGHQA